MHEHWRTRVRQRVGGHVDAEALFWRIHNSIKDDDGWCRFKCRQARNRRIFRFDLDDDVWFVVVAMDHLVPLTVLPHDAEVKVNRKGKTKRLSASKWRRRAS